MVDRYVLNVRDGVTGDSKRVELNSNNRLEVWSGGTAYEIENSPASDPPTGELPVYPGPVLVPFDLVDEVSFVDMANDIRSRFGTLVEDVKSLSTQYDNAPPIAAFPTMWSTVEVRFRQSWQTALRGGLDMEFKTRGVLVVGLRLPLGAGDGDLLSCVDDIDSAFGGVKAGQISYGASSIIRQGASDGWWLVEVHIPFVADRAFQALTSGASAVVDFEAAANAIRTRFGTNVEDALSIKVQYDNAPSPAPDDERWIRLSIQGGDSFAAELSGGAVGTFRRPGVMQAQLFAPVREGDGELLSIADTIDGAFRAVSAGGVTYETPSVRPVGRTPDGKWWQVNVNCPFYFDLTV